MVVLETQGVFDALQSLGFFERIPGATIVLHLEAARFELAVRHLRIDAAGDMLHSELLGADVSAVSVDDDKALVRYLAHLDRLLDSVVLDRQLLLVLLALGTEVLARLVLVALDLVDWQFCERELMFCTHVL